MESTLSPGHPTNSPEKTAPAPARKAPALAFLRYQFMAMDVFIISFMLVVILWTLLSMVAPWARFYSHSDSYLWAEMPKAALLSRFVMILGAYVIAQRFGIYYQRRFASIGIKAPLWLSIANLVYVFIPILLIPIVFNLLGAFIAGVSGAPAIQGHPHFDPAVNYDRAATWWDLWMKQADISIAGVYPAQWFRQYQAPWLTGLMLLSYLSYYVSPLIAVGPQILKRDWLKVRLCAAVFAGALMTTYVGYICVPATGPRFEGGFKAWLPEQAGWFGAPWWQNMLNDAEVIRWDAFPSGHVAIATVALVVALKYHRKTGLGYLPFVTLLPLATVFLGYHYLMDVAFGLLFAAFAFFAIEPAAKWWESIWATE
ncbi:MAG: phosphatase PAP2 family protein [Planctomycetes bacterium]|nr:phosphatase PAP2 family protein [Planctomycetota bacterium]